MSRRSRFRAGGFLFGNKFAVGVRLGKGDFLYRGGHVVVAHFEEQSAAVVVYALVVLYVAFVFAGGLRCLYLSDGVPRCRNYRAAGCAAGAGFGDTALLGAGGSNLFGNLPLVQYLFGKHLAAGFALRPMSAVVVHYYRFVFRNGNDLLLCQNFTADGAPFAIGKSRCRAGGGSARDVFFGVTVGGKDFLRYDNFAAHRAMATLGKPRLGTGGFHRFVDNYRVGKLFYGKLFCRNLRLFVFNAYKILAAYRALVVSLDSCRFAGGGNFLYQFAVAVTVGGDFRLRHYHGAAHRAMAALGKSRCRAGRLNRLVGNYRVRNKGYREVVFRHLYLSTVDVHKQLAAICALVVSLGARCRAGGGSFGNFVAVIMPRCGYLFGVGVSACRAGKGFYAVLFAGGLRSDSPLVVGVSDKRNNKFVCRNLFLYSVVIHKQLAAACAPVVSRRALCRAGGGNLGYFVAVVVPRCRNQFRMGGVAGRAGVRFDTGGLTGRLRGDYAVVKAVRGSKGDFGNGHLSFFALCVHKQLVAVCALVVSRRACTFAVGGHFGYVVVGVPQSLHSRRSGCAADGASVGTLARLGTGGLLGHCSAVQRVPVGTVDVAGDDRHCQHRDDENKN